MMRYRFTFLLLVPLLLSCYHENQPEISPPDHLLSEKEMVNILTDVQLAEGAITYRRTRRIEQQNFRESAYKQVFSTYGINAKILNENLNYYNNNPEKMEQVYDKVLAKLSRIQGQLKEETIRSDSVK
ncbi:MAG: DUF4296 domain-containing protein [Bacteroidales bacterium]|nr:DUF4296 domain-containing protein [Bacteroidales bacterium]